jgi:hypothetical protein
MITSAFLVQRNINFTYQINTAAERMTEYARAPGLYTTRANHVIISHVNQMVCPIGSRIVKYKTALNILM